MALTELVSNLSAGIWNPAASPQGSTPAQSPFPMPIGPGSSNTPINAIGAAPSSTGRSLFLENTTTNAGTFIRFRPGFNNLGFVNLSPGYRESKDFFPLFTTMGENGTSRRMNQGGYGFPFPIGPTGNIYDWKPTAHTGWNINNKYSNAIGVIYGTSGLADTYTTNSPIDDIYNKVKVRSEAWNRNSFGLATDQPFILRGIQRDNNSEPQFWGGFADTLTDIPRGGITTAVEREAVDKARIGKFMISPKGLIFQAKQFGLQLMNPNVEGVTGFWTGVTPRSNKIYNPLSVFSLNSPVPFHVRRDSFDPSGVTSYKYESVINERNILGFGTRFNRLTRLHTEAFNGFGLGPLFNTIIGAPYLTITDLTGPKSVLGIGLTSNNRYSNTSLRQSSLLDGAPGLNFVTNPLSLSSTNQTGPTYDSARYTVDTPYITRRGTTDSPKYTPRSDDSTWANTGNAKLRKIIEDSTSFPGNSKVLENNQSNIGTDKGKEYSTLAYGDITDAATNTPTYNDFRKSTFPTSFKSFISDPFNTAVDYTENNLFKKYGIPEYGASGLDRSDPTKSAVTDGDLIGTGRFTKKDLIDFSMSLSTGFTLRFRAFINSISTNWSPSDEEAFRGSTDQVLKAPKYVGVDHQVTVDFVIPIFSRKERGTVYSKLNTLAKAFYGIGSTNNNVNIRQHVLITPLKIGNFLHMPCVMNSLSYDIDNETPWDIDSGTPMVIACSISFTEIASGTVPSATGTKTVIGF